MTRYSLPLAALLFLAAPAPGARAQQAPVGVNLWLAIPGNPEAAFRDVAKTLDAWKTDAPLTPLGYPTGPATAYAGMDGYPAGDYPAAWSGTATFRFSGAGITATATGPNSAVVHVADGHGMLSVAASGLDPADPLTALHVWSPDHGTGVFRTRFTDRLARFSHVRVMEWMKTNGNPASAWPDRTRPDQFLRTGPTGVAYEDVCGLARATGKPLWVCVPYHATDDHVTRMAALFHRLYPPGLPITVEFSNEIWNTGDPQGHENYLEAGSDFGRAARLYAGKLARAAALWSAAWGGDAGRVSYVMTGQNNNTYWLRNALAECDAIGWRPSAVAVAPYVYLPNSCDVPGLDLDGLFAAMNANLAGPVTAGIQAHAALAASYGLPLWSYEGGQSLEGFDTSAKADANVAVKAAAQDDPRMAKLHADLYAAWAAAGGGRYTHYCLASRGAYGWWGLLPGSDAPGSVKWQGMMDLLTGIGQ